MVSLATLSCLLRGMLSSVRMLVQTVGQLDEDHPDVVRQGEEHFPEVLGLLGGAVFEDAADLGEAVDDAGDLFAKHLSMSASSMSVSSTTSCMRAAMMEVVPRPISSTQISATARGWKMKGSPDFRRMSLWASSEMVKAFFISLASPSLRMGLALRSNLL